MCPISPKSGFRCLKLTTGVGYARVGEENKKGHVYLSTTVRLANPSIYFYVQLKPVFLNVRIWPVKGTRSSVWFSVTDCPSAHCVVSPPTVKSHCNVIAWSHSPVAVILWQRLVAAFICFASYVSCNRWSGQKHPGLSLWVTSCGRGCKA